MQKPLFFNVLLKYYIFDILSFIIVVFLILFMLLLFSLCFFEYCKVFHGVSAKTIVFQCFVKILCFWCSKFYHNCFLILLCFCFFFVFVWFLQGFSYLKCKNHVFFQCFVIILSLSIRYWLQSIFFQKKYRYWFY